LLGTEPDKITKSSLLIFLILSRNSSFSFSEIFGPGQLISVSSSVFNFTFILVFSSTVTKSEGIFNFLRFFSINAPVKPPKKPRFRLY